MSGKALPSVLVVDDDEDDRLALRAIVERAGFLPLAAASGREALDLFLETPVRAVVTDIVMTDGDGISLMSWLRSLKPEVPIIAVSGKGEAGLQAAVGLGACEALTKPVDPEELVRALGEALERGERMP